MVGKMKKIFNWSPKEIRIALLPSLMLKCVLGCEIFEFPLRHRRPILTYIYTLTMILSLSCIFFKWGFKICSADDDIVKIDPKIINLIYACNQLGGIVSVFMTLMVSKEEELCLIRIELFNRHLEGFQSAKIYRKLFHHSIILNTANCCFSFVMILVQLVVMEDYSTYWETLFCGLFYQLPLMMQMTIDLHFGILVKSIGYSFKQLNNNLIWENRFYFLRSEFHDKRQSRNTLDLVQLVQLQYVELLNIAQKIRSIYKAQIFISLTINFLSEIVTFYAMTITYIQSEINLKLTISFYLEESIILIAFFSKMLYVMNSCYNVSLEASKTKEQLLYLVQDVNLNLEINEFIQHMEQFPLVFSICGYKLSHHMITSFILAIMDNLAMVLQLYPVEP